MLLAPVTASSVAAADLPELAVLVAVVVEVAAPSPPPPPPLEVGVKGIHFELGPAKSMSDNKSKFEIPLEEEEAGGTDGWEAATAGVLMTVGVAPPAGKVVRGAVPTCVPT